MPGKTYSGNWKPLGGKSRNFLNTVTGEKISRRQYDKRFGLLKQQSFNSYEQKAKMYNVEVRELRPARGRKSRIVRDVTPPDLSRIDTIGDGKQWRNFQIPFVDDPVANHFLIANCVNQIKRNKNILSAIFGLVGYDVRDGMNFHERSPWIFGMRQREELDADEIQDEIDIQVQEDESYAYYYALQIHVIFKSENIKPISPGRLRQINQRKAIARKKRRRNKNANNKREATRK